MGTHKMRYTKSYHQLNAKLTRLSTWARSFSNRHPFTTTVAAITAFIAIFQLRIDLLSRHDSGIQHRETTDTISNIGKGIQHLVDISDKTNAEMATLKTYAGNYEREKASEQWLDTANAQPPYQSGSFFDKAIELAPTPTAYIQRARNHAYCGRVEAALSDLAEAQKIDPNRADIHSCRGLVFLLCQQYKKADACFRQAEALDQYDPAAYRLQSIACIEHKKPKQALDILNHPLLLQDISTRLTRCQTLIECGRYDEASQDAFAVLKCDSGNFTAYNNLGIIAFRQNDDRTAIEWFSRGLATNHEQAIPVCLLNRAYMYMHLGNEEKAREDYLELHSLRPIMREPLQGLIQIAYKNAQYEEMLQYINNLDALNPAKPDCCDRLQAYYKLYGADSTIRLCEQMLRKYPDYSELTFNAAALYFSENRLSEAEQLATRTLGLDPFHTEALILRGRIAQEEGFSNKALEYFDKAIEQAPQFAEVWYQRGMVYFGQSDYTMAFYDFENAIGANPEHAAAYFGRGLCHFCFHEPELGKKDLATARALNGHFYKQIMKRYRNQEKTGHPDTSQASRPGFDSFYYTEPNRSTFLLTHNGYLRLHTIQTDCNKRTYNL